MKEKLIIILIMLLGAPRFLSAEDLNVNDLLARMQSAKASATYQGTLTTLIVNAPCPRVYQYKIVNFGDHRRHEEMLTDSDEKVVSYDDGQYLWRFFPHKNLVIKESTRQTTLKPLDSAENLELVKKNYRINVLGIYYVNGRTGYRIRFAPKTADRPQQVYWIDAATGVPLKIEKYGPQDQLVSVSSFSDLEFKVPNNQGLFLKVPAHTLVAEVNEQGNLSIRKAHRLMGQHVPVPRYLPRGFIEKNICFKSQGTKKVLQMFYSDGLSSLSVYHQPYEENDLARIELTSTKINVQGRDAFLSTSGTLHTLTVPTKPISSTLMGEIFPAEITKIAGSLHPLQPQPPPQATPASHPPQ